MKQEYSKCNIEKLIDKITKPECPYCGHELNSYWNYMKDINDDLVEMQICEVCEKTVYKKDLNIKDYGGFCVK